MADHVRVDKWLWAVRLFKTRSLATEACLKGHVLMGGLPVKPSRAVRPGDVVKVRKPPIYRSYKVIALVEKRMGAPETARFMEEVTPPEELALIDVQKSMVWITRDRGTGRPTKKERRDLDDFFNQQP